LETEESEMNVGDLIFGFGAICFLVYALAWLIAIDIVAAMEPRKPKRRARLSVIPSEPQAPSLPEGEERIARQFGAPAGRLG
jgi:hypothetical protein